MTVARRTFLGGLGALLGGGKQAAQAAASQLALGMPPPSVGGFTGMAGYSDDDEEAEIKLDIKRQLKRIAGMALPEERERLHREMMVTRLDPDLVVNISMSLSTKYRIQREREIERALVDSKNNAERYLKLLYERLAEKASSKL